jgi:hypothetical protein
MNVKKQECVALILFYFFLRGLDKNILDIALLSNKKRKRNSNIIFNFV